MKRVLILGILVALLVTPAQALPNLMNTSGDFGYWSQTGITRTANTTSSYNGAIRAWTMNETTANSIHYMYREATLSINTNYTFSIYAKEGSNRYVQVPGATAYFSTTNYTNFDLHDCSITYRSTNPIASIESVENGWCRLRVTAKSIGAGTGYAGGLAIIRSPLSGRYDSYTGKINNYTYVYGGQFVRDDTIGTYNATFEYPEANFMASAYSGVSPLSVTLYDNTTPSEIISWTYYAINQSNTSPEYTIETTQNPVHSFGAGNWAVKLKASNYLFSGNSSSKWINVSQAADTTPPDSINTLTTTEITCNSINWSWTNPGDADYDGVMMYINNVFSHNASKYATWGLTQSLQENKDYTLSTHTFDTSENVNSTWVNLTVTTESCEEPIPEAILSASFVANVTCGVVPFNVLFTDTSSGANITGWNWTFGDGNTSVLEDGNNTYSNVGMYTVNHSVTNNTSGVAWNNKTDYIRAIPGWATCSAFEGTGGTGGYAYQLQQAPVEPAIAIIAVIATLFIISRRRE